MACRSVVMRNSLMKEARNSRLPVRLTLAGLLLNRQPATPPAGVGRVHRLADDETRLPDEAQRFREYLAAIRAGADMPSAIMKRLSFDIDAHALRADLRELLRRGGIAINKRRGAIRYVPVTYRGAQV